MSLDGMVMIFCYEMQSFPGYVEHIGNLNMEPQFDLDSYYKNIGGDDSDGAYACEEDLCIVSWIDSELHIQDCEDKETFDDLVRRFKLYYEKRQT